MFAFLREHSVDHRNGLELQRELVLRSEFFVVVFSEKSALHIRQDDFDASSSSPELLALSANELDHDRVVWVVRQREAVPKHKLSVGLRAVVVEDLLAGWTRRVLDDGERRHGVRVDRPRDWVSAGMVQSVDQGQQNRIRRRR